MNRNKEKPYLEFGGNAFYIDLDSILDTIRIENNQITEPIKEIIPEPKLTKGKNSKKNKEEIVELHNNSNPENNEIIFEQNYGVQVDIAKWEILRSMLDVIMSINTEIDDKLGMAGLNNGTSIPFKISFNTLLKYNIIKEEE